VARTPVQRRSHQTRSAILRAAEQEFMEHGFHAARLEDVASAVGIKRAAIGYYYKDKRELYEAVLADLFGGLLERLRVALDPEGNLTLGGEAAVLAWTDYLLERPALVRILLREIAGSPSQTLPALLGQIPPFIRWVDSLTREAEATQPDRMLPPMEALHVACAIAGTTVFFGLVVPSLVPQLEIDLSRDEVVAAHRAHILRITRRLLERRTDEGADESDLPSRTRTGTREEAPG
jgi:TetR/AcrR family transcriptional regulator